MAKKVYIDFELRYKEAVANLDEMQKEYSKLEKQVDKTTESQEELGNILDSTTGGAITKFKSLRGTIGNVVKSFKNLRVAILATGVGALVLAIGSLVAMFKNSEEGQNRFAKLMTQIGVVTGNVIDIISDFGNVMFNVFTGNFKAAGEALNDVTEGIKNFGEETRKEIAIAGELSDLRAKADKQQRELIVERAEADRKRAELLEQSVNKEKFTVQERIEFLKEAGKVEQDITNKEIEAAKLRLQAKQAENELSGSTKEDLDEEANLKAELIRLEQARLTKQKEVTGQIIAFTAEEAAARKALLDQQRAAEKEFAENNFFIPGVGFVNRETFETLKARQDEEIKKQKEADAQAAADQLARLQREKEIEAQKIAIREHTFNTAVRLAGEESRLGKAILVAKTLLAARENILEVKKTLIKAQQAAVEATVDGAKAGSAVAAGSAETAKVGFPQNIPLLIAYAAQAVGIISAVKQAIGKTKQAASMASAGAGSAGGSVSISAPSISSPSVAESIPPQFNLAGGGGANALASALGEQQQAPIQAFVVSGDVSTAQELERNIITGATLG
tara:strand:- start:500 stop:2188 length:1689 start_codon:yes stop_codon:yes gene_type:complete